MKTEKKIDLRIRRTHKLLIEALAELLNEKDFEVISVTEICNKAMINRTTFYKHYTDKYDLIERGFKTMLEDISSKVEYQDIAETDFTLDKPPAHFLFLFTHISENKIFYSLLLNKGTFSILRSIFADWLVKQSQYRMKNIKSTFDIPEPIALRFAIGALLEVLNWWTENNMPYKPEEMAYYISLMYKRQFIE